MGGAGMHENATVNLTKEADFEILFSNCIICAYWKNFLKCSVLFLILFPALQPSNTVRINSYICFIMHRAEILRKITKFTHLTYILKT